MKQDEVAVRVVGAGVFGARLGGCERVLRGGAAHGQLGAVARGRADKESAREQARKRERKSARERKRERENEANSDSENKEREESIR